MCTVESLPQLVEAGINSMKIEGRMKSPVYTAGVVSIYRKYLDRCLEYGGEGYAVEGQICGFYRSCLTGAVLRIIFGDGTAGR